jgi:hypothetical protein
LALDLTTGYDPVIAAGWPRGETFATADSSRFSELVGLAIAVFIPTDDIDRADVMFVSYVTDPADDFVDAAFFDDAEPAADLARVPEPAVSTDIGDFAGAAEAADRGADFVTTFRIVARRRSADSARSIHSGFFALAATVFFEEAFTFPIFLFSRALIRPSSMRRMRSRMFMRPGCVCVCGCVCVFRVEAETVRISTFLGVRADGRGGRGGRAEAEAFRISTFLGVPMPGRSGERFFSGMASRMPRVCTPPISRPFSPYRSTRLFVFGSYTVRRT